MRTFLGFVSGKFDRPKGFEILSQHKNRFYPLN